MSLGSRINEIRKEKNISIDELSARSGVPKGTLSKITAGITTSPTLDTVRAIAKALDCRLDDFDDIPESSKHHDPVNFDFTASPAEMDLIKKYRALDEHGKTMVTIVLAEEGRRVKAEEKKRRTKKYDGDEFDGENGARVIPLYLTPAAAGYASPAYGDDFEYIEVGGDVPAFADYAVKIDGDSMEPYIMNGSVVYVNRDPLANGDVGIFFFDGDMLCKQYYRDEWGNVTLLSLNRARANADKFIDAEGELPLMCYGRVILPHQPNLAVPEEDLM